MLWKIISVYSGMEMTKILGCSKKCKIQVTEANRQIKSKHKRKCNNFGTVTGKRMFGFPIMFSQLTVLGTSCAQPCTRSLNPTLSF